MKRAMQILSCAAVALLAQVSFGTNVLWTNATGNNKWSDAGNWRDGQKPVAGDTVYTSNTVVGASIWVDEPVTVYSIRFEGTERLTIYGEKISVSAGFSFVKAPGGVANQMNYHNSIASIVGYVSGATISNAVEFTSPNNPCIINARQDLLFYGSVTASSSKPFKIHTGLESDTDGYANATPAVRFYGGFEAVNSEVQSTHYPLGEIWFYGRVVMKKLSGVDWTDPRFVLATDDVTITDGTVELLYYSLAAAAVANAFPTNTVFAPGWGDSGKGARNNNYAASFNLCGHDQTIDCVKGNAKFANDTAYKFGAIRSTTDLKSGSAVPAKLTLRGTQDAVATMAVDDSVSLVWDPVETLTQTFSNRVSSTTGSIAVKGGTFRVAGAGTFANVKMVSVAANAAFDLDTTAAGALANLKTLAIAANGSLRIAATAATPFSGGQCLAVIEAGGKIRVEGGQTVTVAGVTYNGSRVADNTYNAATADWIAGDGFVKVDNSSVTAVRWARATDGDWDVADNWLGRSVPSADATVAIDVGTAADMTISVKAGDTLAQSIVLANETSRTVLSVDGAVSHAGGSVTCDAGGVFKVAGGGIYGHTGGGAFDIRAGGEFRVDGGVAAITNSGTFAVGGTLASTGKVVVTSGRLAYAPSASTATLTVNEGGLVELTGGTLATLYTDTSRRNVNPLKLAGGAFRASGTAIYDNTGSFVANHFPFLSLGFGEIVFSGNAQWLSDGHNDSGTRLSFIPATGNRLDVRFEDAACLTNSVSHFFLGGNANAPAVMEFASSANHGKPYAGNNNEGGIASCGYIGYDSGYGEMIVSGGNAGFGVLGTIVGGSSSQGSSDGVEGVLRVKGGWFRTCGSDYSGWNNKRVMGLSVGYGAWTTVASGRPYAGLVEVTDGVVSNEWGYTVIGVGYGKGTWLQKGGVSRLGDKAGRHAAIGTAGGIGRLELSGGTVETVDGVYIGGTRPEMYANNVSGSFAAAGWPTNRHDAEGTLVVSGGTFRMLTSGKSCMLGMDGTGSIEVVGSQGSIYLQDLVLSNTVVAATQNSEGYTTASRLSFTLDENGVTPIRVNGKVVNTPGTQVTVDVGDVAGPKRKIRLIECTNWQGPAFENVTIVGAAAKDMKFATDEQGPYVTLAQGIMLIVW